MKRTYLIISFSLFLFFTAQLKSQTTNSLDTLTLVNGWRLVEYAPGVYYAKTYFDKTSAYHGNYSQWFVVDRPSPNVAEDRKYYAIFKKKLPKRTKKENYLQCFFKYAHSTPNLGVESPLLDIAFGNNGKRTQFKNIVNISRDIWTTYPIGIENLNTDSVDCIYLKISGNFLRTYIQIDYLAFVNEMYEIKYLIDDFEDATIVDVEEISEIPTMFSLSQNYPNPFNPSTSIEFRISKFEHVNLKIFDLLGREIETLVDEYKQAGTYNSKFSIRNSQLPSGVYFYRLRAGKYSETKKMILLR